MGLRLQPQFSKTRKIVSTPRDKQTIQKPFSLKPTCFCLLFLFTYSFMYLFLLSKTGKKKGQSPESSPCFRLCHRVAMLTRWLGYAVFFFENALKLVTKIRKLIPGGSKNGGDHRSDTHISSNAFKSTASPVVSWVSCMPRAIVFLDFFPWVKF